MCFNKIKSVIYLKKQSLNTVFLIISENYMHGHTKAAQHCSLVQVQIENTDLKSPDFHVLF